MIEADRQEVDERSGMTSVNRDFTVEDAAAFKNKPNSRTKSNTGLAFEKHYTTSEIAELWNISTDFVRDLFRDEPGVVAFERTGSKKYTTYRIPESVMLRVHAQMERRC